MTESNDDIARRVLASVLERLEAGARLPSQSSATSEKDSRPYSSVDPVVVVVLGQGSRNETPLAPVTNWSQPISGIASHPGLEKFELPKTSSNASAPKTCFMEA
ncbi:MAG: hypothetical protein AABO41_01915 [Acidobacteriota bacterium]